MNVHLFDPGPETPDRDKVPAKPLKRRVWSENKAKLIAEYLRGFAYVTRHGTYIDAFAGPQSGRPGQDWAAQMVLANEPKWFRSFHLFDNSSDQVTLLRRLASENSDRDVRVYVGDSNRHLPTELPVGAIREREASFCLLDQRTFECEWQLCEHVSRMRPERMKVEQFYFLANSWMPRSLASISTAEGERKVAAWLGQDDWRAAFSGLSSPERVRVFVDKFETDLGYRFVDPWPIYHDVGGRGAVMYYMIHASDHPRAPTLMRNAYLKAVDPPEPIKQLNLPLEGLDSPESD